jgi:hypothetical protein
LDSRSHCRNFPKAICEGFVPLKAWIKGALDHVIQVYLGEPDLEFVSRRRRRGRPAATGADAEHSGRRRDQDALMSRDFARRRMMKFMPSEFRLVRPADRR